MRTLIFILIFVVVLGALTQLPDIELNKDEIVSSNVFTYIRAALYFFPVGTVAAICGIMLSLWVFRIIVAVVKVIWDLLPVG